MTFSPLIIWAKALFFFEQLFPVVARTWLGLKSGTLFLGPKFWFLAQKSDFCHTTPILVDDPFLALGMTVNFPPWKPFFDFPFRSYSCFRKKNWQISGVPPKQTKQPADNERHDSFLTKNLLLCFHFFSRIVMNKYTAIALLTRKRKCLDLRGC